MAVDDDNILVTDAENNHIQKFTADGKFITAVGSEGKKPLQLNLTVPLELPFILLVRGCMCLNPLIIAFKF